MKVRGVYLFIYLFYFDLFFEDKTIDAFHNSYHLLLIFKKMSKTSHGNYCFTVRHINPFLDL
jgi:hypothetical protein